MKSSFLIFSTFLVLTGCSSLSKWEKVSDLSKDIVYQKPVSIVWHQIHEMLTHEGYVITHEDPKELYLETDLRKDANGATGFSIQLKSVAPQQTQVEFLKTKLNVSGATIGTENDYIMQWKLLQRIDPNKAREIETNAEKS